MRFPPCALLAALVALSGLTIFGSPLANAQEKMPPARGWPAEVTEIRYPSRADQSEQPALYFAPPVKEKHPLLVALHTWSGDYKQRGGEIVYGEWCVQQQWAFIHPQFRGPNRTPEALGSELMVEDILSAVEYAKSKSNIDPDRIYLVGVSGGGHASLLMAGRAPDVWAGVSAWCGISDVFAWHQQCKEPSKFAKYARDIEGAVGGDPTGDRKRQEDCARRSPVTWLANAAGKVPLDINHGINDGRRGSVPFTHSLHAWNAVMVKNEKARFSESEIESFYQTRELPGADRRVEDPLYGERQPIFRVQDGAARLTIFDGGHEIVHLAALNWLANQRKRQAPVWKPEKVADLPVRENAADTKSGL